MSDLVENIAVTVSSETRLHPLSFAIRRVLHRIRPESLATLALLAGLSSGAAQANTIHINASCTLINAITAANTNAATGGCPAGSGADTLVLPVNSIQDLTAVDNVTYGANGLPVITSQITITGNGSTIQRDSTVPAFRIFAVGSSGNLMLNSITVSGGDNKFGAGVFNRSELTLNNSTISGNSASLSGGGLENDNGTITLNNSTVSGNSAGYTGGGLENYYGTLTIRNSTISGNSAASGGGLYNAGLYYFQQSILNLSRSLVSGNTAPEGAEIYNNGGNVLADQHNLFGRSGNAGAVGFTPGPTDIVPSQTIDGILKPLAANGGATQTHLLPKGSAAINASPNDAQCAPKRDQRGVVRPQGSACDIGAVEVTFCDTATPTTGCTVNGVANQRCEGIEAADTIIGTGGNDIIRGLGGNDILKGAGGNDKLCGGVGNDRLEGGIGLDQLFGGFGSDRLFGGDGDDKLFGEQDNDSLDGGLGADKLNGGRGMKDTCTTDVDDSPTVGCEL